MRLSLFKISILLVIIGASGTGIIFSESDKIQQVMTLKQTEFNEVSLFCNFCSIIGLLSISNKRYEPPCKSKPKLIFLSKKSLLISKKFNKVKKLINSIKI